MLLRKILLGVILVGSLSICGKCNANAEDNRLFQDNFSNLERSKEIWKSQDGFPGVHLFLKDGVLRIDALKTGAAISVGDDTWTDYIFNAKIRFVERGEGDNHAGFNIRRGVTIIGHKNDINYNIAGVITETGKGLDEEKKKVPLDDGKWHYFRFICKGADINVWVDGEEIGIIKPAPLKGGISLYGFNCNVEFDDVSVEKIAE